MRCGQASALRPPDFLRLTQSPDSITCASDELCLCCAGAVSGAAFTAADQLDDRFFYQAADGQWIFLTQLDLRVLAAEHGGLASCPARVEAVITDMDTVMQTEATRRRFKRMSHVPLTGESACVTTSRQGSVAPRMHSCRS